MLNYSLRKIKNSYFLLLFVSCFSLQINSQTNLCVGATNSSAYTGTGGSWISGNTAAATVNATGLVTGAASGSSTVVYQTGSNVSTYLYWDFDNTPTQSGGICTFPSTTASNSGILSGSYKSTGSYTLITPWSFWGNCIKQTSFGPYYTYIEFVTTTTSTALSSMVFQVWHNHTISEPVNTVQLQLSTLTGGTWGAWTNIGSTFNWSSSDGGSPGPNTNCNISLVGNSVVAGTHRIRWAKIGGIASTGGDGYILNTVQFNCVSNNTSTLFSESYTILGRPTITTQPLTTVQNVCQNGVPAARFVTATGAGLTYQWYVNTANNNTSGTLISGATSASFTPPSDVVGTFYYYCIVSGTCTPAATSTVSGAVNINAPVTVSDAGLDQTDALTCGLTSVTLAANTPTTGTGAWSIVSGTGGTITTPTSPTSNFSGVSGNSYTLRWTITNGGCVSTDDVLITLNAKPVPVITPTGCGTPKTLTSSTWTSYLWGPNNETTNSISVSVSGTYTVTTTNAIGCVSNPVSSIVNLTPVPVAGTLSGTQAICVAGTSAFTTDGNTGGTWTTSAAAIATVNASTGIVTGVAAGTATITYTIPAANGCTAVSSTRTVTVTTAPNAGVLSGTQAVCSNGTVTFTTNGNAGGAWSSSDAAIANINATSGLISPVAAGTSTMTYTVTGTGGCANATATRTVTITTAPNAGILSGTQAICSNATTNFTTDGNTGGAWTSGTTSIATVNVSTGLVTAVANATGTSIITYTITGTGGCANTSATRTVTVTAIPVITVQPLATVQNICQNGVTAARSVTATGGGLTYQWYVNTANNNTSGTSISTATLASYTPPSTVAGTFYYYCIVSGTCTPAVTSAVSGVVNIFAPATVSNAGADQTGSSTCGLTSVALAGNTPTTGTGAWSIVSGTGGTITTAASPTSNFSGVAGNSYTLRWTITNGACVSTDDVLITFNIRPVPVISQIGCSTPMYVSTSTGGNALELGASNTSKYVSIPATLNSAFSTNRATLEGWFNQSTSTVGSPMLIGEGFNGDGKITFCIYMSGQTIVAGFYNGAWIQASSTVTLALNTWTHIAATYDQTSIKIYVNGILNSSFSTTVTLPTGTEVWYLGKRWDGTTETFSGKMDELRIWNIAKTQEQIQAGMNTTIPTNSAGLKAYYKLDESTGTTAADATVNGYTGTLLNAPTWQVPSTSVVGGNPVSSFSWTPNGETTNNITATASGTYSVVGTSPAGCVSNPVSTTVTISAAPSSGTLSGTQAICVAGTSTFTTDGNTGGTWTTSAAGVATVNASTGVVTGVAAGTATITYTIVATAGCSAVSSTRTVTVTTAPNAGVLSGTQTVCSNGTVTFTTNGNAGGAWSSSATGVANINATSGVISPVAAGTSSMTYTVTGTGGCANATATRTVTITTAPNAGILSGTQAICSNATTNFTTDGNTGGAWTSATPSVATVNVSTGLVTAVANATGTSIITYTITGTGGCANTSATRTVTVTAIPVITVQPVTTVQNICQSGSTTALSVSATGGGLTYQWYVNTANNNTSGTSISTATLASYTPPSTVAGTFYYYCIVSGTCTPAVTSAVSGVVNIFAPATVSNAGADQTGSSTCGLTSVALAGNTPTTGTGAWSIVSGTGGTITTAASPTSNFSGVAGNSYTLRWTITNGGCVSTDDVLITLNSIPADASLVASNKNVELLVIAGGGGAGFFRGGGGGGGGYISVPSVNLVGGSSTAVTVGAGGAPGSDNAGTGVHALSGTNSSFGSTSVAIGGGGGGSYGGAQQNGYNGGSGGGGANQSSSANTGFGGTATAGQGNIGGNSRCGGGGEVSGGGGGGAGAAGTSGTSSGCGSSAFRPYNPGNGGNGIQNSISGTAVWYAGGGGGGGLSTTANIQGANGNGGGQASYGGGGQCKVVSNNFIAESGGPGIVIVKYLGLPAATGGTITQAGGYTIHTFTAPGTFALAGAPSSAVVPNQSRCGAGTVTFTSTITAGLTLDWYDAATGGTLLSQGTATYTTPIISASTTYYVAVRNATTGCVSAARLAVTATINGGSTITANQTICVGTNPANIVVTSAGSTFQWQSSTDNITFADIVGQTSATLTGAAIGNVFSTKYYRAFVTNGSCSVNSPVHTISVTNPTLISTPVSGNIIWRGTSSSDWTTLANWNQYNGTNYIAASILPVAASNVIIPAAASCIANQPTILTNTVNFNNLTIETGAYLTATTGTMNVNGNWTNNGTFTSGTGTVNFTGNTAQSIGGNNASNFYNLTINKSGNSLTLSNPTTVANTLTMTAGNIVTTTTNLLTVGTSTTSVGSLNWTAGSVVGPLQRYFSATANATAASGIFPVGNTTNNRFAQVNFTANPTTGGTITAQYIPGICPIGNQGLPATINGAYINNYEDEGYWSIAPSGGNLNTTTYSLTLHGLNLSTVTNLSALRIIKSSNHSAWNDNVAGDGNNISPVGINADFTISASNMLGFSWFNVGSNSANALPIELIAFQGTCQDELLNLQWSTASEQNSAKYIIEKSRDLINWQTVAEKIAAGNSNYLIEYAQADTNPFEGINYYQLRQIDFDGAESKFGPISVSCNSIENNYVLYPNPTAGSFNVELFNTEQETIQCAIYDLSGKLIYQRSQVITQGSTLLYFENLELQKGSYIFKLISKNHNLKPVRIIID